MSADGIKSTDLARELGVKATDIVTAVARLRGTEYKKGTTNIKLSDDEAAQVRNIVVPKPSEKDKVAAVKRQAEEVKKETVKQVVKREAKKEVAPQKEIKPGKEAVIEAKPVVHKKSEPDKEESGKTQLADDMTTAEAQPAAEADIQKQDLPAIAKEDEDLAIPDRFRKEVEVDKVEKIKVKPTMQKAFQTVRKIEQKKWVDLKSGKKPSKFKKPEVVTPPPITAPRKKSIKLNESTTVKEFAEAIGHKIPEVIKKFMEMGYMPTINQPVDTDAAMLIAEHFGVKIEFASGEQLDILDEVVEEQEKLIQRPPVVTIMGHVDHGKTSLLDAIRETKVTETEAGGITQHIGAYKVSLQGRDIAFLDTPGHEAFTALRARGAKVTDIVVLVVAADDGVMPQTIEAIDHAKAAIVPIVVAMNKIDKPEANPERVRQELAEHGVVSEAWGGQNIFVEVSAKKRIGIQNLLEMILLQAEVMELKANPDKPARGTIIEAKLDRGRGPIATVLIQSGTLKVGDAFVAGGTSGKVRALIDDTGKKIQNAGPSTPVEVIGFAEVPTSGDIFTAVEDERKARQIALIRNQKQKGTDVVKHPKLTLDELYAKIKEGQIRDLNIVLKGDVQGSVEAIKSAFEGITHPEVKVNVIHTSVGGINESDVMLAAASNAIIIGFNVRPETKASHLAEKEGVDIRLYNIIYEAIENVKKALEGMLEPTIKEKVMGRAEVRQTYSVSRLGTIAGCYVVDGIMMRASDGVRVIRDNIVVYQGKIASLKRFKDDAKEVATGYECGIMIENFNDLKTGDILENFVIEKIAAKL
ncbi:MAG TPA: translation initiation factor IF-2 [Dissulfurispiraceae bacterium]|nr:translation initiation factor IF-2 [Dissulfurispiraceae bacterium]